MRVAFLTHHHSLLGANRSLLDLIRGLEPFGVESFVVAPEEGDVTTELRRRQIPVAVIPYQRWLSAGRGIGGRWKRALINYRLLPTLVRQLREWRADIIHSNSSVIAIGQRAAERLGKPHVWHFREFGDLHYGLKPDWGWRVYDQTVAAADALVAISQALKTTLRKAQPADKIHVIYNGVASQATFDELRRLDDAQRRGVRPYTFLIIGVIHPSKGQDVAIRAFATIAQRFPSVRLVVAGPATRAEYLSQCRALVERHRLRERVHFPGFVEDPFEAILAADAILMCSQHEGMGRVTAEAMAACRPVVGLVSGATPELIEHERTGLLYQDGVEELASCMTRLVENPEWGRQLGQDAWRLARERYSIEAYSQQMYDLFMTISGAGQKPPAPPCGGRSTRG